MSEASYVLDASALLAAMLDEPGTDMVAAIVEHAVISAINLSEVVAKLQDRGVPDNEADSYIAEANVRVVDFDATLAIDAGRLRHATRPAGLSLGDRACLALGRQLGATVITADRAWAKLDLDIKVELIR